MHELWQSGVAGTGADGRRRQRARGQGPSALVPPAPTTYPATRVEAGPSPEDTVTPSPRSHERGEQRHDAPAATAPSASPHTHLLAAAGAIVRAAAAADERRLHAEVQRLHADLAEHVEAEREVMSRLPGAAPALVREGTDRLLQLIEDLREAISVPAGGRSCVARTVELDRRLRRQFRLEATLLARHAVDDGPPAREVDAPAPTGATPWPRPHGRHRHVPARGDRRIVDLTGR